MPLATFSFAMFLWSEGSGRRERGSAQYFS
jgi:hypothetical protein